ncbi:MAG: hypothetical protein J0H42_05030 [Rhizobiales bacterium]|nr:hypothetical protein [Hyphomicrobiales bacterium]
MTTSREMVLIGGVVDRLTRAGSWCGETHIQKTAYMTKALKNVPFESEFILYKHGPYSFDLNKSLNHMSARSVLSLELRGHYGPSYRLNEALWGALDRASSNFFSTVFESVDDICRRLAKKNVAELERVSTAVFVNTNFSDLSSSDKIKKFVELKPHVSRDLAQIAFEEALTFK